MRQQRFIPRTRSAPSRVGSAAFGVGATLLLHAVFLQTAVFGGSHAPRKQEEGGPGATAIVSSEGAYLSLVMVNVVGSQDEAPSFAELIASRGVQIESPVIQVASPDPAPLLAFDEADQHSREEPIPAAPGDPNRYSILFGRYTQQINSRIGQAWRKPREAVDAPDATGSQVQFRCQARIRQDKFGYVKEIELLGCNGSPAWQLSLVRAIEYASPLPSPPDADVFSSSLTLAFEASRYRAGTSDESEYLQ